MADISPPKDLKPKAKFFAEVGEEMVNVDGVIAIMQEVDTPQANAIYRVFRKKYAIARSKPSDLTLEKMRENALFDAFEELGIRTTMTPLSGTMD